MRKFYILVSIVLLIALILPVSMVGASSQDGPPGLDRVKEVKARNAAKLLEVPGVVAVGVGPNNSGRAAVVIFTDKPGVRGLPASVEGVPVVARVSGQFVAYPKGGKNHPQNQSIPPRIGGLVRYR